MLTGQQKTDTVEEFLGNYDSPCGTGWGKQAQAAAEARFRSIGLPARKDEYWRFAGPNGFSRTDCERVSVLSDSVQPAFHETDCLNLVFIDGVFRPDLSDREALKHVDIVKIADAMALDISWAKSIFGKLESRGQDPVRRPFAALNSARASNGFAILATGRVSRPVCLSYLRENDRSDAIVHSVVLVRQGGSLTLLENGPGAARLNSVLEVELEAAAAFDHVRVQGRDHERRAITHMFARLAEESSFRSFTMTANGSHTRNEAFIELCGDDSRVTVAGVCVGDGAFLHDDSVFVVHDAERCESRQVFKKVLGEGAKGVFQGKILVKPGAQKTDGYQISKGLLLDETSQFLAKPELEIYADDVACSHGSTTGAIDEEALFYLMSRGISRKEAERILVLAFLEEAVDEISDRDIAEDIRIRLAEWIARHRS
ncbi:MAG: SufD family Fe-S cluster assembly protein [Rhodobacteraceae bacterium]|nr:SufD family Fe-S cluster assembly protein [Paracoccaceae bacterium]